MQALVQRFETLAGRSAMVCPRVRLLAEYTCLPGNCAKSEELRVMTSSVCLITARQTESKALSSAGVDVQIGFIVASIAELAVPRQGLFGAWAHFDAFAGCSALLIASSVVRACRAPDRQLGQQLGWGAQVLHSVVQLLQSVSTQY